MLRQSLYHLCSKKIIENVSVELYEPHSSEEIRNIMFLLEKILVSGKKDKGIRIVLENKDQIIELINQSDSISALGFGDLLNSIYNYDHKEHNTISRRVSWSKLMKSMMQEKDPNYYAWGQLFNRGISLLGKKRYSIYRKDMYEVWDWILSEATVLNIEGI